MDRTRNHLIQFKIGIPLLTIGFVEDIPALVIHRPLDNQFNNGVGITQFFYFTQVVNEIVKESACETAQIKTEIRFYRGFIWVIIGREVVLCGRVAFGMEAIATDEFTAEFVYRAPEINDFEYFTKRRHPIILVLKTIIDEFLIRRHIHYIICV
jgi:hypothetical protein